MKSDVSEGARWVPHVDVEVRMQSTDSTAHKRVRRVPIKMHFTVGLVKYSRARSPTNNLGDF